MGGVFNETNPPTSPFAKGTMKMLVHNGRMKLVERNFEGGAQDVVCRGGCAQGNVDVNGYG